MRLEDKVAIVTGAARGIGQEFCYALAAEGAKVVAVDILSCEETIAKVMRAGGEAMGITTDVTDSQRTQAMAAQVVERFGRIDILVNNAAVLGGLRLTPFEQIPEAEWDRVMEVNVKGMWLCSKAVVPTMRKQGKGRIINISSGIIWMGVPMLLHYVASKGAVMSLSWALARELSGTGINVNVITPGATDSGASRSFGDPETIAQISEQMVAMQIIKRTERPSDLSGTLIFLASEASDFITGQTINVDGGLVHH